MKKMLGQREIANKRRYAMSIIYNNDQAYTYKFTNVVATGPNEAIDAMKRFVAKNGWFGNAKPTDIIAKLSAIDVREI